MKNGIPQPFPYQGSKRRTAAQIVTFLPGNKKRLVEPFAGSAAISISVASNQKSVVKKKFERFWINDAQQPLSDLWMAILSSPSQLLQGYEILWTAQLGDERAYFDEVRTRFNLHRRPVDFLYLLARCVKAAIRYNSRGDFNNTPDNRRLGTKPPAMCKRIMAVSELLAGRTTVTCYDYERVLDECTKDDVVYMDPPYQGVCGPCDSRYEPNFSHRTFVQALSKLNDRRIAYLVSYDGRTGEKVFGQPLPDELRLRRIEIDAGRSSQSTLLGRNEKTIESLYLSPALSL
jgi:DNA adenine methylase